MAEITRTGIVPRDLSGYRALLEQRYREAFGEDLATEPETPAGQMIGIQALSLAEADEIVVSVANGLSVEKSVGIQIHDLGSLFEIRPEGATYSTVALTLGGVVGTVIDAGSRVRNDDGSEFALDAAVTIGAAGTVAATATATETGPVAAVAGTLTTIVTLVAGWETVTNAADANQGRNSEPDPDFRARYRAETGRLSDGPVDAIRAALSEAGVTRQRIEVNDAGAAVTRQGLSIGAHGVMCICQGGLDADIAAAVLESKGVGTTMSGSVSSGGAMFERVSEVPITVAITTVGGLGFPADGLAQMRANLVDYALGDWRGSVGQFDTDGFQIGETVDSMRLLSPINAVPGHSVSSIAVAIRQGNAALPTLPDLNVLYTLALADVTVTIS